MVVYADVLIVLNLFVNYFILLVTAKLLRRSVKILRVFLGSLIGAIASLYIFLPHVNLAAEISFKIFLCLIITVVTFGIRTAKLYLKATGVLFLVTCSYAGAMIAIWHILKPKGMVINNSIVYFNISPISIVVFSAIAYLIFTVALKIFGRTGIYAKECDISISFGNREVGFKAIVDTGNSVSDIFGKSEVIIVDESIIKRLFDGTNLNLDTRYRAIPFNSVSGYGMLDGYRCDSGTVKSENRSIRLKEPIIAASKTPFGEEYFGIVNPKILD